MRVSVRSLSVIAFMCTFVLMSERAFSSNFYKCGWFECDATGCILFRSEDGLVYEATYNHQGYQPNYVPDHRACITGWLQADCTPTCSGVTGGCVSETERSPWFGSSGVYASSEEFAQGQFRNVHTVNDEIRINPWSHSNPEVPQTKTANPPVSPYIWVACSQRGTVVRIATEKHYSPVDGRCVAAGDILGQYYTGPAGNPHEDPSRVTVDYDGNVWVANRQDIDVGTDPNQSHYGHVAKIGSGLAYQWVDRNANGKLDTSRCDGEICDPLPWAGGVISDGIVSNATDELILRYHVIVPDYIDVDNDWMGTRTVAVDRNNDVWVGGSMYAWHEKLDGQTATTIPGTGAYFPCGGYMGVIDCKGVLWSSRANFDHDQLLRYDPAQAWVADVNPKCWQVNDNYGLGVDTSGKIWNSQIYIDKLAKIDPDNESTIQYTVAAGDQFRGVAVSPMDDDVWVASSESDRVYRYLNDATANNYKAEIAVGNRPTGMAVDSRGKIWVPNEFDWNVMRIDPTAGPEGEGAVESEVTVYLGDAASPYSFGDMTGMGLLSTISPAGVWSVVYDGCEDRYWDRISWTESVTTGAITVQARSDNQDFWLGKRLYVNIANGAPLEGALMGRYLQVRVQMNSDCHQTPFPVLTSLTVSPDLRTPGAPLPAPYPHDRRKNRYISFDTNKAFNDCMNIAFKIEISNITLGSCNDTTGGPVDFCRADRGAADCNSCVGGLGGTCITTAIDCSTGGGVCTPTGATCINDKPNSGGMNVGLVRWVSDPKDPSCFDIAEGQGRGVCAGSFTRRCSQDEDCPSECGMTGQLCTSDSDCTQGSCSIDPPCVGTTCTGDYHIARAVEEPHLSTDWPSTVQISDCEIVPGAIYRISAVNMDTGAESDYLEVETTKFLPDPGALDPFWWGDAVGGLKRFCDGDAGGRCSTADTICHYDGECPMGETCSFGTCEIDGAACRTNYECPKVCATSTSISCNYNSNCPTACEISLAPCNSHDDCNPDGGNCLHEDCVTQVCDSTNACGTVADCPDWATTCDRAWTWPNGTVNFDDVNAALTLAAPPGVGVPAEPTWVDLHGGGAGAAPNFVINASDLQNIIFAFQEFPYKGYDPKDCPDEGWKLWEEPTPGPEDPEFTLVASDDLLDPEQALQIEVYVSKVTNVSGHEVALEVTGGTAGTLIVTDITVDTQRSDYIYHGAEPPLEVLEVKRLQEKRSGGVIFDTGISVSKSGAVYLATFTLQPASGATGVFEIKVAGQGKSFLLNPDGSAQVTATSGTAVVGYGVDCLADGHCDDNNECTTDTCSGSYECQYGNVTSGTPCEDGLWCTRNGSTCNGNGQCTGGNPQCQPGEICLEESHLCMSEQ